MFASSTASSVTSFVSVVCATSLMTWSVAPAQTVVTAFSIEEGGPPPNRETASSADTLAIDEDLRGRFDVVFGLEGFRFVAGFEQPVALDCQPLGKLREKKQADVVKSIVPFQKGLLQQPNEIEGVNKQIADKPEH
jgi:hypothetical protein